ncbi:acyltransferase [Salinibacterium sp. dk2585]|uniref:acyltransferase family protein n=1 Tax=unclassified Salinibacterium TaxID=2632331 RepID=UPI0011C257B3|nr:MULTISPECIES: acyltransferase family protein [unclassified Salinibacterium]QEE60827.1 acyltransferase [Salinibacterium sp. dk2585]TXK55899.1 acyltransferase [Salinibacterium sp. dk5596]
MNPAPPVTSIFIGGVPPWRVPQILAARHPAIHERRTTAAAIRIVVVQPGQADVIRPASHHIASSQSIPAKRGFRTDIQGLRAVAVALVVIYHLWPNRLSGGYVGVDVFFVISGFLITSHLLDEVQRSGTVALATFWARRIRRLLPAALLVLAVALMATVVWAPDSLVAGVLRETSAAALYVVNWVLLFTSVDYLRGAGVESPVQHFWSLSVEEQFYFVWPMLIVGVLLVLRASARRRRVEIATRHRVASVFGMLALVFVASLLYSVILTAYSQPAAYFSTLTRTWEFAAGGLAAAAMVLWPRLESRQRTKLGSALAITAAWAGLIVIVWSAFALTDSSPFPGWVALAPVLGTVLVLIAGGVSGRLSSHNLLSVLPMQKIGDWSYSIYLWHWPLIFFVPFAFDTVLSAPAKVGIGLASVALAAATKWLVEDPVRRARGIRTWHAFIIALVGPAVIVASSFAVVAADQARYAATATWVEEQLSSGAECFGAKAMAPGADCGDPTAQSRDPDTRFAATDLDPEWCVADSDAELVSCQYGELQAPARTIALVGDSHAAALAPALQDAADDLGWRLVTYLRVGCPALSEEPIGLPGRADWEQQACADWSAEVQQALVSRDDIDTVVYSNFSSRYHDGLVPEQQRLSAQEIAATWTEVRESGKQIVLIRDVPDPQRINIPLCLSTTSDAAECATKRVQALPNDEALRAASQAEVPVVDLSELFCDEVLCHAVIGDVVVYADDNHISRTFARTLSSFVGAELGRVTAP